jgi:RimJ/RimL family protein N-acetyltransferase
MTSSAAIPYRIVTPRLVVRCWQPADAVALNEAIAQSWAHLHAWLPWAKGKPATLDEQIARLTACRESFPRGREHGIFDRTTGAFIGGIGFPARIGAGAREIGYWTRIDQVRKGYMIEAAAALVRIGFACERLRRIEIHCDPRNHASAAIPRRLGFHLDVVIRDEVLNQQAQPRDTMVWTLLSRDATPAPVAAATMAAFDAADRPIPLERQAA